MDVLDRSHVRDRERCALRRCDVRQQLSEGQPAIRRVRCQVSREILFRASQR